jgi:hypothetical protein
MNLMYKQINYMDSLQDVDKMNKSTIVDNMVYVSYFYVCLFIFGLLFHIIQFYFSAISKFVSFCLFLFLDFFFT